MTEQAAFWFQLISMIFTVLGGLFALAKALGGKFDKLEEKMDDFATEIRNKLDAELKHVHLRVDKVYLKLSGSEREDRD